MQDIANVTGIWWSYAEGDSTLLGGVAVVLVVAAVAFVGTRVFSQAWALVRRRR